jgi:putative transposase
MKYVETNPLRANMVEKAEDWKWGSLYQRMNRQDLTSGILAKWPVEYTGDYLADINKPLSESFLKQVRYSSACSTPLGDENWVLQVVKKFGLEHTTRQCGRPPKVK